MEQPAHALHWECRAATPRLARYQCAYIVITGDESSSKIRVSTKLSASESDLHIAERTHSHRLDSHKLGVLRSLQDQTGPDRPVGSMQTSAC